MSILSQVLALPEGYSEGLYNSQRYSITRETFNRGKSYKVFARELGGTDYISLNLYLSNERELLKPCEMPEQKVLDFLKGVHLIE